MQSELEKFSSELSKRKFAIALTKIDAFSIEESNEKIKYFMDLFGFESNKIDRFKLSDDYLYFINEEPKYKEPMFIIPISSVTHTNTSALKYMLYEFAKENGVD